MEWTPIVDCAYDADITVADEANDKIAITIQLKDFAGNNLTVAASIKAYMANESTGLTYHVSDLATDLVATTGTLAVTLTKGVYQLVSTADGLIIIDAEDDGDMTATYLVLVMPNGRLVVSDEIDLVA